MKMMPGRDVWSLGVFNVSCNDFAIFVDTISASESITLVVRAYRNV